MDVIHTIIGMDFGCGTEFGQRHRKVAVRNSVTRAKWWQCGLNSINGMNSANVTERARYEIRLRVRSGCGTKVGHGAATVRNLVNGEGFG